MQPCFCILFIVNWFRHELRIQLEIYSKGGFNLDKMPLLNMINVILICIYIRVVRRWLWKITEYTCVTVLQINLDLILISIRSITYDRLRNSSTTACCFVIHACNRNFKVQWNLFLCLRYVCIWRSKSEWHKSVSIN